MKFSESLKKNKDFQVVYKNGKSYANRYLVLYIRENGMDKNRLGISVSKKVGNSVVRHHLTRLIRESYRLQEEHFQCGFDLVVIARAGAKERSYHSLYICMISKEVTQMKKILIGMIRFYQKYLSGLKTTYHCIYTPTCSQYGIEAIEKYGAVKGLALTVWRILRCNPFAKGGYDPVP